MSDYKISYDTWKQVAETNPEWPVYRVNTTTSGANAVVFTGNAVDQFRTFVQGESMVRFERYFPKAIVLPKDEDALALLASSKFSRPSDGTRTLDGKLVVSAYPTVGNRVNIVTHRWNDPTTWLTNANEAVGVDATILPDESTSDRTAYSLPHQNIIDASHGKLWKEDFTEPPPRFTLESYTPKVTVNGVDIDQVDIAMEDKEGDFHQGRWKMDYAKGTFVIFDDLSSDDLVEVSYFYAGNSVFVIEPTPGKKMDLNQVEIQFSSDVSLRDTTVFQTFGLVDFFAPHLVQMGWVPSGTVIPLGDPVHYKTFADFCNEANGSLPMVRALSPKEPTWRDMRYDVITLPWSYQAVIELRSSLKMRVEMSLLNDIPHYGDFATVTVYGLSSDE